MVSNINVVITTKHYSVESNTNKHCSNPSGHPDKEIIAPILQPMENRIDKNSLITTTLKNTKSF